MRHLLALLDGGTHGTPAEPWKPSGWEARKTPSGQHPTSSGTCGTRGTLENEDSDAGVSLAQRVADLAAFYQERMAIVMEAGDISDAEAETTAALEVGREFIRPFLVLGLKEEQGAPR